MEDLRYDPEHPELEDDKLERVKKVVRGPDWSFLRNVVSLPGNPYYKAPSEPRRDP